MQPTDKAAYAAALSDLETELKRIEGKQDAKLRKIATLCNAALALRDQLEQSGDVVWLNQQLHRIASAHGLPDECVLEDDQTFAGQTLDTTDNSASSNT
ncbi:hypothetical protein [Luteimonas terrae]|uniref:Uncharacterized protein n=1 Tax=Luteimonas terrae TaxID=1530191 RepID=A0A4R5UDP1_9GAMM|nr:hypothetical protein [Luteimonas terrae]TDK33210.1 hypothetical protein E2F49_04000 [Luteimonas terrae]